MLLSNSFKLASMISLTRNVTLLGPWCETQCSSQGTSRLHHRVVAWEVPFIAHAGTCTKQKRCAEDWKKLWWNGMDIGLLLNERNLQPYKEAVEHFEKLDIREINLECWRTMLYSRTL
ncbi:hypothetical protein BDR04DRAFT_4721 [Suillus decipiens]|nr:hypothetical protein BDR04DRAFT_4721 [Suillus decipiens]